MKNNSFPKLITRIPGPKASRFVQEDKRFISQSYTGAYPLVVEKAKGLLVTDNEMGKTHCFIGDVRGKGLMIGVELVRDKHTKERAIKERNQLLTNCFKKGLIILGCGENSVRFLPPLIINRKQAAKALEIFEESLSEVEKS